MGVMLLRLLLMAHLLPLSEFAAYSLGLLISSSFCMLGCLGLQSVLQRDLPVLIVRRRERVGATICLQCVVVASACAVLAWIGISLCGSASLTLGAAAPVASIGILHGLAQQVFLVATVESRSRRETMRFAI